MTAPVFSYFTFISVDIFHSLIIAFLGSETGCERDAAHSENNNNSNNVTQVVNRNRKCGEMAGPKFCLVMEFSAFQILSLYVLVHTIELLEWVAIMCDGGLSVFQNENSCPLPNNFCPAMLNILHRNMAFLPTYSWLNRPISLILCIKFQASTNRLNVFPNLPSNSVNVMDSLSRSFFFFACYLL